MKEYFKITKEALVYIIFLSFINLMRLVGIDRASNICASIFKLIGPMGRIGWIVRNNLQFIYDDISQEKVRQLEKKIWDNFGRYVGEFAFIDETHLKASKRVKIEGADIVAHLRKEEKKFIMFSGHFANWDYVLYEALRHIGESGVVYRKVNNRFIDAYLLKKRSLRGAHLIRKGSDSREIIKLAQENKNLMMLVDQKMNEGIRLPLLGRPANTATGLAALARQFDYLIVPTRIERLGGAKFKVTFCEPFAPARTDSKENDIYNTTLKVNDIISGWVAARPDQWLWQHQRWGKPLEMSRS